MTTSSPHPAAIQKLAELLDTEPIRVENIDGSFLGNFLYEIDEQNQVIGLRITGIEIPATVFEYICNTFVALQKIEFRWNKIENILSVKFLINLQKINFSTNEIIDISPIQDIIKLQEINFSENKIEDISPIQQLTNLKEINFSWNEISDISSIQQLTNLKQINFNYNQIKKLPEWLLNLPIDIVDSFVEDIFENEPYPNPIESPPIEIIKQGKEAMRAWFEADKKTLKEIKVILIGDAQTGKTSLLRRLKDDTYNAKEPQTDGILIEEFAFDKLPSFRKQKSLLARKAYFWDFGGQEIMSATHQFFLTKRSVYLLLLEARRDQNSDQQVREWLARIYALGGNSPVLVVINKMDLNPAFGLNTTDLQKDFPQIMGFASVSCKSRKGLADLKELLASAIDKAELFQTEIDTRWHGIKDRLRELTAQKQYIQQMDFEEICEDCQLPDHEQQQQAIRFLNDLGIVLHFDDLRTSDYFVLDPYWVVTGVYKVITSERAAKNKGNISYEDLHYIFQKEKGKAKTYVSEKQKKLRYNGHEINYIAEIMARFKLCYFMENRERILIPDLLESNMPAEKLDNFEQQQPLRFMYEYAYLPTSTIHFLMVDMQKDIQLQWRTGMYLKSDNNIQAEAFVYASDNKIKILVLGRHKDKYLSLIRYFLSKINQRLNTRIEEFIPVEGKNISYHELVNMKADGEKLYKDYTSKPTKVYSIAELLEGISDSGLIQNTMPAMAETYKKDIQFKTMTNLPPNTRKVKVFFSYSHKDDRIKENLDIHFSTLKRLEKIEVWHDRQLTGGQDWDATIKKELQEADVILLMISANFVASTYIWEVELKQALERHERGEAVVIPIFGKSCDFSGLPFAGLQGYPRDAKFISKQTNKDAAYTEVAKEVRRDVEALFAKLNP